MDNTIGTWICDRCKHEMVSFLYNKEYHIPEKCPKDCDGKMIEDETKRERPSLPGFARGKQGEDKWLAQQSPTKQADVLLGRDPDY